MGQLASGVHPRMSSELCEMGLQAEQRWELGVALRKYELVSALEGPRRVQVDLVNPHDEGHPSAEGSFE
jgi:hypothetical protein